MSSGQIRSAWKWYLWIGPGYDVNRYICQYFNFNFEFLNRVLQQTDCIESSPPICWRTFVGWKIRQCAAQAVFRARLGDTKLPSKNQIYSIVPAVFWRPVWRKEGGLRAYKPSSQELGDKIDFWIKWLMTLNLWTYDFESPFFPVALSHPVCLKFFFFSQCLLSSGALHYPVGPSVFLVCPCFTVFSYTPFSSWLFRFSIPYHFSSRCPFVNLMCPLFPPCSVLNHLARPPSTGAPFQ